MTFYFQRTLNMPCSPMILLMIAGIAIEHRTLFGAARRVYDCPDKSYHVDCKYPFSPNIPCNDDKVCRDQYPNVPHHKYACCNASPCKKGSFCMEMIEHERCKPSKSKNVVFLIDGSANYYDHWSKTRKNFKVIKNFIKKVIEELDFNKRRVSVIQFGGTHDAKTEVNPGKWKDSSELTRAVDRIKQVQGTGRRTGEALAAASNKLYEMATLYGDIENDIAPAQGIIVLITRGSPSDEKIVQDEIKMLKQRQVQIIPVGVGNHADAFKSSLERISCSNNDVFITKYKEMSLRADDVVKRICSDAFFCNGAPGFTCENKKYDIYFAVDASVSIDRKEFKKVKNLLKDLLILLKAGGRADNNVGILQFREKSNTREVLPLQRHSLKDELGAIDKIKQGGIYTKLGYGLSLVDQAFNNGWDRADAKNIVIIFSDGQIHDLKTAKKEAKMLKKQSFTVLTVVFKKAAKLKTNLGSIASDPKLSLNVELTNQADISSFTDKIESLICQN